MYSANTKAMTISIRGRIIFWMPLIMISQNSAAGIMFCAIYMMNITATVQRTPISMSVSKRMGASTRKMMGTKKMMIV